MNVPMMVIVQILPQNNLDVLFNEKNKPAYEKLLDWIIREYSEKKELKKYKLFW